MKFLTFIEGLVFLLLALLHFYWAFGGKWGFSNGLPTTEEGEVVLNPGKIDSIVVGVVLLSFSLYYLNAIFLFFQLPSGVQKYTGFGITLLFLLRAIGDFKYVGFFKKIKGTSFARRDQRYFSPLCLALSIIALLLALLN